MTTRRRGTTLLELVVALAVTGVVALVGASTFETLIDRRETVRRATIATGREGAQRALVREWVQNGSIESPAAVVATRRALAARASRLRVPEAVDTRFARTASPDFNVVTSALTPLAMRDVFVRLYVDDDPDTPERGLSAEYRQYVGGPVVRQELDALVTTLEIEWLDAVTRRWTPPDAVRSMAVLAARLTFGGDPAAPRLRALPLTVVLAQPPSAGATADLVGTP